MSTFIDSKNKIQHNKDKHCTDFLKKLEPHHLKSYLETLYLDGDESKGLIRGWEDNWYEVPNVPEQYRQMGKGLTLTNVMVPLHDQHIRPDTSSCSAVQKKQIEYIVDISDGHNGNIKLLCFGSQSSDKETQQCPPNQIRKVSNRGISTHVCEFKCFCTNRHMCYFLSDFYEYMEKLGLVRKVKFQDGLKNLCVKIQGNALQPQTLRKKQQESNIKEFPPLSISLQKSNQFSKYQVSDEFSKQVLNVGSSFTQQQIEIGVSASTKFNIEQKQKMKSSELLQSYGDVKQKQEESNQLNYQGLSQIQQQLFSISEIKEDLKEVVEEVPEEVRDQDLKGDRDKFQMQTLQTYQKLSEIVLNSEFKNLYENLQKICINQNSDNNNNSDNSQQEKSSNLIINQNKLQLKQVTGQLNNNNKSPDNNNIQKDTNEINSDLNIIQNKIQLKQVQDQGISQKKSLGNNISIKNDNQGKGSNLHIIQNKIQLKQVQSQNNNNDQSLDNNNNTTDVNNENSSNLNLIQNKIQLNKVQHESNNNKKESQDTTNDFQKNINEQNTHTNINQTQSQLNEVQNYNNNNQGNQQQLEQSIENPRQNLILMLKNKDVMTDEELTLAMTDLCVSKPNILNNVVSNVSYLNKEYKQRINSVQK